MKPTTVEVPVYARFGDYPERQIGTAHVAPEHADFPDPFGSIPVDDFRPRVLAALGFGDPHTSDDEVMARIRALISR